MYWDLEWEELAQAMGPMPPMPTKVTEEKSTAANAISQLAASRLEPPPDNVSSYDEQVPNGPKIRVYKPHTRTQGPLPLIYFVHGGGWFADNLDTEDRTCRMISSLAEAVVVSVDYNCGVEVSLEDEVHDCILGFDWAYEQAKALGADPKRVVVIGGSAGGALAVATTYAVVQAGKGSHISGLVLLNSLALNPDATPEKYQHLMKSYVENAGPLPFVSGDDTFELYRHWNITPSNININVFPAAGGAGSFAGFPPTFIITSNNDASRDDGTVLEAMIRDAGVRSKIFNFEGLAHYFWTFPLPKANERLWKCLVDGIYWTLSGEHPAS